MGGVGPFAVPLAMTNLPSFQGDKEKGKKGHEKGDNVTPVPLIKRKLLKVYANGKHELYPFIRSLSYFLSFSSPFKI
jgi:hypothetical protein